MKLELPIEKAMRLLVERIVALPCPTILDDMFSEAGVGLIWIPPPHGREASSLRDWSAADLEQIDVLVRAAGGLIAAEMKRSGYPIIHRKLENGASMFLYRRDLADKARKLSDLVLQ